MIAFICSTFYAKGEQADLTEAQKKALGQLMKETKDRLKKNES